ncbi:hypothetical protein HDU93_006467, partial [Gonapodya sp. JEL0774]
NFSEVLLPVIFPRHSRTPFQLAVAKAAATSVALSITTTQLLCKLFGSAQDVSLWDEMLGGLMDATVFHGVPRLFLFSDADRVMDAEYIQGLASDIAAKGFPVATKRFKTSEHVRHRVDFPREYWGSIEKYLFDVENITRTQELFVAR